MGVRISGRDKWIGAALRGVHLFLDWPIAPMQELRDAAQVWSYEKNEIIANRNAPSPGLWVVAMGSAITFRNSAVGKYLLQGVHWPGDVFGLTAAIDGRPLPFSHAARTDAVVIFVPRTAFDGILRTHNEVARSVAIFVCTRARVEYEALYMMTAESLRQRVAKFMAYLPGRALYHLGPEPDPVDLTQDELASMMGVARQTLNRTIGTFVRDGIVECRGNGIHVINFKALLDVIEESEPLTPEWRNVVLSWDEILQHRRAARDQNAENPDQEQRAGAD